jgi:hypothetical protein
MLSRRSRGKRDSMVPTRCVMALGRVCDNEESGENPELQATTVNADERAWSH